MPLLRKPVGEMDDLQFISDLYERYRPIMYNKAMVYLADPQDVDDLIHDCMEHLIRNISTLRQLNENALTSYIVTTVRNTAINLSKHLEVQSRHIFLTDFEGDDPADSSIQPEDIVLTAESTSEFMQRFNALPEEDRILLRGKYVQRLKDSELAELFGCAASSIRMKLTRAKRRAISRLSEGDYFSEQT